MPSTTYSLASTEEIIADMRAGKMVVLVDEEDRENEGDLVLAADHVTPEAINFMAKHGRGLICLTLTRERCEQLNLPLMVRDNTAALGTNFTVSIEAAEGVTTGISAADRSHTVKVAVAPTAKPRDIVMPGHIFPLMAQAGGVLVRSGHTEAGCDLAELAGCSPAAVICEIMKDDGEMARLPDLVEFAKAHQLKIGTIVDLIHYRSRNESIISRQGTRVFNTPWGPLQGIAYKDSPTGCAHLALIKGQPNPNQETLVRVHEPATILDLLETESASHSWPVAQAIKTIAESDAGAIILLNCAGTAAVNTDAWFNQLGKLDGIAPLNPLRKTDFRTYGIGAQILKDLGIRKMKLLAKPGKLPTMAGYDLEVTGHLPFQTT
jgi:3,4-dihydroxy 2-butanone 4-phosphate synthase / GTP cyclohydrolase II